MAAVAFGAKKQSEKRDNNKPRSVFEKYDKDKSGKLDKDELLGAFADLGVHVKLKELDVYVKHYGKHDKVKFEAFDKLLNAMQELEDEKQADLEKMYGCVDGSSIIPGQREMIAVYNHPALVYTVASCIIGNFLVSIVEKEIDPMGKPEWAPTWNALDAVFNIIFLIELLMNMYQYAGPRKRFWKSMWNCFDTFIVAVGVILMIGQDSMPASLKKLKLLRALRVLRLFKRVKSLNKIVVALVASIPGVMNAFVLMIIFFCIYAILAVELFSPFGESGEYPIYWQSLCETTNGTSCAINDPPDAVGAMTARGYTNGYEYYGTFSRALFTLFQVMTGESWSEAIARPLIFGWNSSSIVAATYFVSFIILTQIVLMNVVVAVLLDKFASGPEEEIEEKVDLAELVKRMEEKEVVALYVEKKEELVAPTSPDAARRAAVAPDVPSVKMPSSIAKLPTDKGDIDQLLQLLKRMDARLAAIELQNGGVGPMAGETPTRLPPPSSHVNLDLGSLSS